MVFRKKVARIKLGADESASDREEDEPLSDVEDISYDCVVRSHAEYFSPFCLFLI